MSTTSTTSLGSEITTDSFLTLFTTQMRYQDPLDPQDNSEFLSQLAQFTTLEQTSQQTEYLADLSSLDTASLQLDQIGMLPDSSAKPLPTAMTMEKENIAEWWKG